jgi:hypothetical protein
MWWRKGRHHQCAPVRGEPDAARRHANLYASNAEAVAEEHMRTVSADRRLVDLVHELAQRGESLAVENLDWNYVDGQGRSALFQR